MNYHMWEITKMHQGENGENVGVELQDPDGWFDANVRWDGLMELHIYHNVPKGEKNPEGDPYVDTVHLADLDGFIRRLEDLKQMCQELFDHREAWKPKNESEQYHIY